MQPKDRTVRALAADAGVPAREAVRILRKGGFKVSHPSARVSGVDLKRAREALGLRGRARQAGADARVLTREELTDRILKGLWVKKKVAKNRTTAIENSWGRSVPSHQKGQAQQLVEEFLTAGLMGEKMSQGRRHVWITGEGVAFLNPDDGSDAA
ncbi:MAG: hypothetical protein QF819_02295 [Gemmatimonadota bacterium]|jgi:hypothetical protein|nr:hypothetical protein [Gemmatimonadota bacterium]MDP6460345.1 hypothetical protein [Gemmatimonadota bacterium]MDP6529804.1 hypothetical protein [Gemmatimonadota bacterium]MDP6801990.1 hypothetical protein [Gemmatimonadota bacterium]MDP7031338.1 hypothetical protein [Gemmatimonadota bacterium]